ncbi:hypothetical protein, partial [Streptomyces sp. NPDC006624]|uniref:hypothetical protein n=1 Tax=Streptomyces sp. NPDC006624 TaxID=3154892 RepID=UPI0033A1783C
MQRILRLPLARGAGGLKKISEELRRAGRHSNQSSRIGHNTKVDGGLTHSGGCRLSVVVDYTSGAGLPARSPRSAATASSMRAAS